MTTHLEAFVLWLTKVGIPYTEIVVDPATEWEPTTHSKVRIMEGIGYNFFYVDFYFDSAGKSLGHGVWE